MTRLRQRSTDGPANRNVCWYRSGSAFGTAPRGPRPVRRSPGHVRLGMLGSPRDELFVLCEHGVDELIEHVLCWLAEEVRVRVKRFARLAIEACDVSHELFTARAGFDEWHGASFRSGKREVNALRFEAPGATKRRWIHARDCRTFRRCKC